MDKVHILHTARQTSDALGAAIEAVKTMQEQTLPPRVESWGEREQRLAEGRGSPTGWPIKRLPVPDDCITIPRAPLRPSTGSARVESMRILGWIFGGVQ